MVVKTKLNRIPTDRAAKVMLFMPIMFSVFFISSRRGVTYWVCRTCVDLQQCINRIIEAEARRRRR